MTELMDLKRQFIEEIEAFGRELFLQKNYLGLAIATIMEEKPMTQDEIMQITGYGRSTVSSILRLTNQDRLTKSIKVHLSRKKYFKANLSIQNLIFQLLLKKMELIKINANFLTPFLEKIKNLNSDHPEVEYFYAFLIKLQCVLDVYFRILPEISNNVPSYMQSVMDNFSQYQPNNKQYSDVTALKREKFVNFSSINGNSEKFPIDCEIRKQLDIIKKELIYEIENMITYTRKSPLLGIVLYVLFFEYYPVSQDRIIELTGYGRSSISEALTQLIDIKLVQKMKKPSDRHHYYYAKDDWDSLLKARISSLKIFLLTGNKIVEKYGEFLGKINANVEDAIKFHNFLGQLKIAFNEYGKFVDGFITKFNELII